MNTITNEKRYILNNKITIKPKIKNIFLYQQLASENNKNSNRTKSLNIIKNIKAYSSLTINPQKKSKINLKLLKYKCNKNKNGPISSSPNIHNFQTPINNKNVLSNHYSFNYRYLNPSTKIDNSLYKLLALSQYKMYDGDKNKYNSLSDNKRNDNKKKNHLRFLVTKSYINECNEKNKNEKIFDNIKITKYISCIKQDFINSEKIRFYNMMKRLAQVKIYIESDPKNEFSIIKTFFLNIGLFDKNYYTEKKLKNFLKFIKNDDFMVDPSITLKDNIINIINNGDEKYNYDISSLPSPKKYMSQRIKNIIHMNKNLYRNRLYKTLEKFKIKRFDLNLKQNMKKQNEIMKVNNRKELDIIKEPEKIMNEIEDKLKDENDIFYNKSYYSSWNRNLSNNKSISYSNILNNINIYDLNKLKKRNLITEYACFEKAKDNFDLQQIKLKYNV